MKPRTKAMMLSVLAVLIVSPLSAWLSFHLSFAYFAWKYPHDGQDVLGSIFLAVLAFATMGPLAGVLSFRPLYRRFYRTHVPHRQSAQVSVQTTR